MTAAHLVPAVTREEIVESSTVADAANGEIGPAGHVAAPV
jgi:hypothetical protein